MKTFTNNSEYKFKKKNKKLSPIMNFIIQIVSSLLSSVTTIFSFSLMAINFLIKYFSC